MQAIGLERGLPRTVWDCEGFFLPVASHPGRQVPAIFSFCSSAQREQQGAISRAPMVLSFWSSEAGVPGFPAIRAAATLSAARPAPTSVVSPWGQVTVRRRRVGP